MYTLAFSLLALAMLCALFCSALAVLLLWRPSPAATPSPTSPLLRGLVFIEKANLALTSCFILSSAILVSALVRPDFSLVYVASYTDLTLPLFYRLTAFWAGQAGSMLFWALSVVLCGAAFQLTGPYKRLSHETRLWYWTFYLGLISFFGLLLVTWNNPFLMNHGTPGDGNGLNPLLQNPGMIFHPPLLLLGYGGFVIPGCLALAQTLSRFRTKEASWTEVARPFTLTGWAFLTAGIALGAWWAYMELGWGGYWAWDPVENASLIPWLTATAALHTIIIQTRRNKLHGVNVFLMALTTISALFATYLVRSGVVQSVHAFGEGNIGGLLLTFILFSTALALWIALIARDKNAAELAGLGSREGFLVLTSWLFLALGVIILIATMWPVFTAFWNETILGLAPVRELDAAGHDHGGAVGLTADFYNRVCMPLFAALMALLAVCPWLSWNGGLRPGRQFFIVIGVFIAALGAFYGTGYTRPVALFAMAASSACLVSCCLLCAERATRAQRPSLVACGIHFGLALVALGIAFSGPYKIELQSRMSVGESAKVGPFEVTFKNLYEGRGPGYVFLEGELEVSRDGKIIGTASPQRRVYNKWDKMQFAEASTLASWGMEFYASLTSVDRQGKASFSLSAHPLVNALWIGSALMSLLPFLSLRRRSSKDAAAQATERA